MEVLSTLVNFRSIRGNHNINVFNKHVDELYGKDLPQNNCKNMIFHGSNEKSNQRVAKFAIDGCDAMLRLQIYLD